MGGLLMNRRLFVKTLGAGIAGTAVLGGIPAGLYAADDFVTLTVLHTNDIHAHIEPFTNSDARINGKGGLARISGMAQSLREVNPNTLLFDAGDVFQGTPFFNYFGGKLLYKLMSEAGYDAGTIGNHEFDNGLKGILDALPEAKFPLINSNYDFSNTILAGKIPQWKIFRKSGVKIGVYGLGVELDGLVSKKSYEETIYLDPVKVAGEMETFLKKNRQCDLVICLSHLGHRYNSDKVSDIVIAGETRHTDLIIGGHTHTYLKEPLILKNKQGLPVIVNSAWWGGLVLGRIDFVFERQRRKIKNTNAQNIL
jgi:5'-nucleotidase